MMHYRLFFPLILLILVSGCGTTTPQPTKPNLVKPESVLNEPPAPRVQIQTLTSTKSLEPTLIEPQEIKPLKVLALIPLSGRYQAAGKSIQTGLVESFYQNPHKHSLFFLDSAQLTQESLDAFIKKQAIDAIIGPLVKETIQALEIPPSLHQLTLNTHPTRPFLSLALSQEFAHLTQRAKKYHESALILFEESADTQTLTQTTQTTLRKAEIQTVESAFFPTELDRQPQYLEHFLRIDQSRERIEALQRTLRQSLASQEQMRTDASVIFIHLPSSAAQQLQPFKKYVHNNELSLYSTSKILDSNASNNKDLNGIFVAASPANIEQQNSLSALGFDAWALMTQMPYGPFEHEGKASDYTYKDQTLTRSLRTYRFSKGRLVWQK